MFEVYVNTSGMQTHTLRLVLLSLYVEREQYAILQYISYSLNTTARERDADSKPTQYLGLLMLCLVNKKHMCVWIGKCTALLSRSEYNDK